MANGYYTHTTFPGTNSSGSSASMRSELDAIMAGFAFLPNPLGSGQQGFTGGNWSNPVISGGSIDNASIGATSRSTGRFTTIDANGAVNFSSTTALGGGGSMAGTFTGTPTFSGAVVLSGGPVITGGAINSAPIGGTTRAAGAFTTLAANAAVTFSNGGALTGVFTGGTYSGALIENTPVGSTTRAAGAFTTLGANAAVTFSSGGTLTGTFTGGAYTGATVNNTPVGNATPSTGAFTTLSATGAATFSVRPTFNSNTPWDGGNLVNPVSRVPVIISQTMAGSAVGAPAISNYDFASFTSPAANGVGVGHVFASFTLGPAANPTAACNWSASISVIRVSDGATMSSGGSSGITTMLPGSGAFNLSCATTVSNLAASTAYFIRLTITGSTNPGTATSIQDVNCNGIIF